MKKREKSETEEVYRLYRSGCSYREIGRRTGIDWHVVGNMICRARKDGIDLGPRRASPAPADKDLAVIAEMYLGGRTLDEIGERIGVSYTTVRCCLLRLFSEGEWSFSAGSGVGYEEAKRMHRKAFRRFMMERRVEASLKNASEEEEGSEGCDFYASGAFCEITMRLSRNVGMLMGQKGLSERELADAAGIGFSALSRILNRKAKRCYKTSAARIASALDVSPVFLINGDAGELKDAAVAPHHVGSSGYSGRAAITKETRDEIVRLYNSGYSKRRIAEEVAVSQESVKRIIKKAKDSGEAIQRGHGGSYKLTDAQIAQAVELHEAGATIFQIATMFGVGRRTICNYVRREKEKKQNGQEEASSSEALSISRRREA